MKDYSIFQGWKELHGAAGDYRIEIGNPQHQVSKRAGDGFVRIGLITAGQRSNAKIYQNCVDLSEWIKPRKAGGI